jgi:hypothetical protein
MPLSPAPLRVEAAGSKDFGPCECCGKLTRRVWGYVRAGSATEAAYFVEWHPGSVRKHGAMFDLIIGRWGDHATAADRIAVSLAFRQSATGPSFMVVDASAREVGRSGLVGRALDRQEVLAGPVSARAYAIIDTVWLHDDRIVELRAPDAA